MIKFRCGECDQKIGMPDGTVGRRLRCPRCKVVQRVPGDAVGAVPEPVAAAAEAAAAVADGPSPLADLADEFAMDQAETGDAAAGTFCPGCGADLGPGAVLCVSCGYHLEKGKAVAPVAEPTAPSPAPLSDTAPSGAPASADTGGSMAALPVAVIAGSVAAGIGGGAWALVVMGTGYEIGWLAWGIGLIVGAAVAGTQAPGGMTGGTLASMLAVGGLLLGKVLILQFGLASLATQEVVNDPQLMAVAVAVEMVEQGDLEGQHLDHMDRQLATAGPSLTLEVPAEVERRVAGLSNEEKRQIAETFIERSVAEMTPEERMATMFSPIDFLWFLLAVGTAFRLGYSKF